MRQRNNQEVWTPAEMAIYNAMREVEKMPAHVKLTDAVILLSKAQNAVADYLEEVEQPVPSIENYGASDNGIRPEKALSDLWKQKQSEWIDSHIIPMYATLRAQSIKYFLKDGTVSGSFRQALEDIMNDVRKFLLNPDPQNAQKEPVIDNLRDKFFKECVEGGYGYQRVVRTPHNVFEWFKPYLKSKGEPVIDWEGLEKDMEDWIYENWQGQSLGERACRGAVREYQEWLKSNLSNYIVKSQP